jgi:hypothetical protein
MKMGQAYDREGNVLGEAFGDTKAEVFQKLQKDFANAHEIRIRSLMSAQSEAPGEATDKTLSQRVADLEKAANQLAEIEATLWINFGDMASNKAGFVITRQKPLGMLLEVLRRLTKTDRSSDEG